jgi:hypothetical protein
MPSAFIDVALPLVRLVFTRKRWGASCDVLSIRLSVPGAYCFFDWRPDGFYFLFDPYRSRGWRYRHRLGAKILWRKLRLAIRRPRRACR